MARTMWRACVICIVAMSAGACDRGPESQRMTADAIDMAAGKVTVTVTGCFQEMAGFDNFVLSNVGDAPGVDPAATRAFRIEQSGNLEQHVGTRVTIRGSVNSPAQAEGMMVKRTAAGEPDFNDLPELHVESVTQLGEACGSTGK